MKRMEVIYYWKFYQVLISVSNSRRAVDLVVRNFALPCNCMPSQATILDVTG